MMIRGRAAEYFGEFAALDAGWQILLCLFSNPQVERTAILSELRRRLGVPESTLKRCLHYAELKGFVLALPNGGTKVHLSKKAQAQIEEIFADA